MSPDGFATGSPRPSVRGCPGPGIPMVIDDGFTRTVNFGAALAAGTLGVYRGCFTKTTP